MNGPGGRIDPGETVLDGAIREVYEELRVTPTGVRQIGELRFQFTDGYSILCYVFTATGCEGDPVATAEATPLWTPIGRIPFDLMWEGDGIWMPLMLTGTPFRGCALFHGERMLGHAIVSGAAALHGKPHRPADGSHAPQALPMRGNAHDEPRGGQPG